MAPSVELLPSSDVLHTNRPERIRLSGIDCPEKRQAYSHKAKEAISELVFGKDVTLQTYGKDKYVMPMRYSRVTKLFGWPNS
jgi:endonuclease YncB( thermonuclease family)